MGKSKGKNAKAAAPPPKPTEESSTSTLPVEKISVPDEKEKEVENKSEILQPLECPICKNPAVSRCGACNEVAYCSREHQKQHWKIHKNQCVLWKISESPQLGRYLTATRDIKPGKVVIQESPLLITSPKITAPICLGCYHEFLPPEEDSDDQQTKPGSCPDGCGWPMCNTESCKQNRSDHNPECKASLARGGLNIRNFGQDHPMYQAIGVLRALALKETRPKSYDQLLTLQSNAGERGQKNEQGNEAESSMFPPQPDDAMAVSIIRNFFQLAKSNVSEDLIRQISGIIETNGHEIPIPGNYGQISRRLIGVYHTSSFLEHNCRPNCTKSLDSNTKNIVIRTSIAVKKGDHLSISYVDPLWGTNDRQNFLQMTKSFTCNCERCRDATELGCHISSVRCQQIQCTTKVEVEERSGIPLANRNTGMIVPDDPLNPESQWKCITCGEIYPVKYASSIVEKIGREIEDFQEKRGDIGAEEEFIRKFSKVLAPNHFYLLEIKVELAQLYGRTADEPLPILSPQKLLRKIALCEEVLHVLNVIVPGLNRLRALILYELQAAHGAISKIKHSFGEISIQAHLADLLKCQQWLNEVVKVLSWEPELSVEFRRCEGAKRELADLESLITSLMEVQNNLSFVSSKAQSSDFPNSNFSELQLTSADDEDELELF